MGAAAKREPVVAAFDLDGTLARGHTLPRFAAQLAGVPSLVCAAGRGCVAGGVPPSRQGLKVEILARVLGGRPYADVEAVGCAFADDLVQHRLVPEMADRVQVHRALGHALVLVTAALDVYAEPAGELLGFDGVIATQVAAAGGVCSGALIDADLHNDRKVERLQEWLGAREPSAVVYAYGNSGEDEELLAYARATRARRGADAFADLALLGPGHG